MKDCWDTYLGKDSNRDYWLEPDASVVGLVETSDKSRVKDVLDLGCGIGRHTIPFAAAGFHVTAADSSAEALDFLRERLAEQGLSVEIIRGNYNEDMFPEGSFDLVLAYNVLYHGSRDNFRDAASRIHKWLRPGGRLFLTCPTRRDGKYGNGEEVAPNTYRPMNSIHPGDIHYFSDEVDITEFLGGFSVVSKTVDEHHWQNGGTEQFSSYWRITAVKGYSSP